MKSWMREKIRKPYTKTKSSSAGKNWLKQNENKNGAKKSKRKRKREQKQKLTLERKMAAERCAKYLKEFWPRFQGCKDKQDRMFLLKEASGLGWWVDKGLRLKLRAEYRKQGFRLLAFEIETCGICEMRPPEEKHHVVMLAYGGINANVNLLAICMDCHDEIHPWLKEEPIAKQSVPSRTE